MLKSQDCLVLIKLLANPYEHFSQRRLSDELCISLSEVNAALKRLTESGLLQKASSGEMIPVLASAEEFLLSAVKYLFPGKLGAYTRGIPTAVAAPIFQDKIAQGNDPIPVWPDARGNKKGMALDPLHPSVTKALNHSPDEPFYELLVLVDAIRVGRARERNIAKELLIKRISGTNSEIRESM